MMFARSGRGLELLAPSRESPAPRRPVHARDGLEIELRQPAVAPLPSEIEAAWRSLAGRSLEPNPFLEPEVLLPALQHLPEGRRASLALIWRGPRLVGLAPLLFPGRGLAGREVRLWTAPDMPAGGLLVDREGASAVVEALLSYLAERLGPAASLRVPAAAPEGPLGLLLAEAARGGGRPHAVLEARTRPAPTPASLPPLAARGPARIQRARSSAEIRDAVEEFLLLDARSADGPALIQDPGRASFLRAATRQLARRRLCRVELLRAGGRLVAAAIVLKSGGRAWLWKVAAEPGIASAGLGLLLSELARAEEARGRASGKAGQLVDMSGAAPGGPAWTTGIAVGDLVVAVSTRGGSAVTASRLRHRLSRDLRRLAGEVKRRVRAVRPVRRGAA